jgi:hypothetical protein
MAIVPKPSGEIPNHQLLSQQQHLFHHQKSKFEFQHIESINKAYNHTGYSAFFVHFLIKIPRMIAGNNEAAANPKASATTAATKPGGG